MLKYRPLTPSPASSPEVDGDPELAAGSSPSIPASPSVIAALITQTAEPRALCALVRSSIVSGASSTCGARGAIAAAFDDLSVLDRDAIDDLLRGKPC